MSLDITRNSALSNDSKLINVIPNITTKNLNFAVLELGDLHFIEASTVSSVKSASLLIVVALTGGVSVSYKGTTLRLEKDDVVWLDCFLPSKFVFEIGSRVAFVRFLGQHMHYYYDMFCRYNLHAPLLHMKDAATYTTGIHSMMHFYESSASEPDDVRSARILTSFVSNLTLEMLPNKMELRGNAYVSKAMDIIIGRYKEKISLEDIAKEVNVEASYLGKLFKKAVGVSPSEYLMRARINKAKELLRYTDLPLDDISEATGFSSSSYFIKVFLKLESITPGAFRKNCRFIR